MKQRLSQGLAEDLLLAICSLLKAQGLYPPGHTAVKRAEQGLSRSLHRLLADGEPVLLGRTDGYLVIGDVAFLKGSPNAADLQDWLERKEIEGVLLEDGILGADLARFCRWLRSDGAEPWDHPGIRLTRLERDKGGWKRALRVYRSAVRVVEDAYRQAQEGCLPDPRQARACVESFSELLSESPGTLSGLVLIKDYDLYTFHHSVNVCLLSLGIARSLGLSREEEESVGVGGLLHDIGKTRTPAEVIRKPGRLTDHEWTLIWQHPSHGRDILAETGGLPGPTPQVVLEHHLRHDGGGYPRQPEGYCRHPLSGLVTVADVYDAMTTHRSYSLPRPLPEAVRTLTQQRGTHFEPRALDAFLRMVGPVPVGSVVRLAAGEVAVVSGVGEEGGAVRVRPVLGPEGQSIPPGDADREVPSDQVVHWVDPLAHGIDAAAVLRRGEA